MVHPDDELLSALLDGEAPPGDVAHVDGCPACQNRLQQLRFASETVAASIPIPPGHLREASLAVAMRTADAPVRSLPTLRRWNSGLSAAAVLVVALAVGGLLITQLGRNSGNDARNTAQDNASVAAGLGTTVSGGDRKAATESDASSAGGGTADAFDDSNATLSTPADSTMSMSTVTDLGEVDDIDAVSKRSTEDLAGRDAATDTTLARDTLTCPPDEANEPVLWHATLTYKGTPAVATVRQHSATTRITEIRAREGCARLATQEFEPTTPR